MNNNKLILVTGGARSGKSSFGEAQFNAGDMVLYIATAQPFDEEMRERVRKHRQQRPEHWETLEAYKGFTEKLKYIPKGTAGILLDCITLMVTNILLEYNLDWDNASTEMLNEIENTVAEEAKKLIAALKEHQVKKVLITNELGWGLVPDYPLGRIFRDIAGRINQYIASEADEVYIVICGIPNKLK